jgi:hypothetical protein
MMIQVVKILLIMKSKNINVFFFKKKLALYLVSIKKNLITPFFFVKKVGGGGK